MKLEGQLLPEHRVFENAEADSPLRSPDAVRFTRDHAVIKRWAEQRGAIPATGEATPSGPATVQVSDGGAGVRFNFPGAAPFRTIDWEEWFENFDRHDCAFVFDNDAGGLPLSNRYRIVRAADWQEFLR